MNYKNLIKNRKSTRDYKPDAVDDRKLQALISYFHQAPKLVPGIKMEIFLLQNGNEVFELLDGKAGYNGRMIKAPEYIIITSEDKNGYMENTGFVGEQVVLKAADEGIDTCWITYESSSLIKDALELDTDKEVTGIIAVGYGIDKKKVLHTIDIGDNYSKADIQIIEDNASFRYSVEDIVFLTEWGKPADYSMLEQRGIAEAFTYLRLAPSTLNHQPWKFIIDGSVMVLTIKDNKDTNIKEERMDAGIVMLYFYLLLSETIYTPHWYLGKTKKDYKIPENYRIVSWCVL